MNYYDLTTELAKVRSDIEDKMNYKKRETNILNREQIDREIDFLECRRLELINILKSKKAD